VPRVLRTPSGAVGFIVLVFVVGVAVLGPLIAPHDIATPIGGPGQPPSSGAPLGTDYIGRDVLSRLLNGGRSVIWIGGVATLLSYLVGMGVGLVAGYSRSVIDPLLMRAVDVLLAFPALLVLLLLVGGLGPHIGVLIVGVALVQLPGIARIVRTATLETSTRGFVEAAEARGEPTLSLLVREILPNIAPVILADFGIRFGYSIILIASVNYLGLGLAPPAADWGLMISENQQFISLNLWAVLAPAIMLALLTIGVNLLADTYVRTLGSSAIGVRPRFAAIALPDNDSSAAVEPELLGHPPNPPAEPTA
jgi:ABC-type dipeptide/oligopeptide/nickel transport system permease subunit